MVYILCLQTTRKKKGSSVEPCFFSSTGHLKNRLLLVSRPQGPPRPFQGQAPDSGGTAVVFRQFDQIPLRPDSGSLKNKIDPFGFKLLIFRKRKDKVKTNIYIYIWTWIPSKKQYSNSKRTLDSKHIPSRHLGPHGRHHPFDASLFLKVGAVLQETFKKRMILSAIL